MRNIKVVAALTAIFGLVTTAVFGNSDPVDDAIRTAVLKNGFDYAPSPPTTEGGVGALYVKMKTTSGHNRPQLICYLFPQAVTINPSPNDTAVQQGTQNWPNRTQTRDTSFSFFAELTKAVAFLTGASASFDSHNVKSITITWGDIKSRSLALLDLKQASQTATSGSGTYKGQINGPCFDQAKTFIANKTDAYLATNVATANSLTATVTLNAPTTSSSSTQPASGSSASGSSSGSGVSQPSSNGSSSGSSDCTPSTDTGTHVCVKGGLLGFLNLSANGAWKQTSSDTLTLTQPANIGFSYVYLSELHKIDVMGPPRTAMRYTRVDKARLSATEGSLSEAQVKALRAAFHLH